MRREEDSAALRVAIAGMGPKGLFALERLLDRVRRAASERAVEVTLFEPHPVPGAGPVYDPGQPPYLRMNFAADRICAWPDGSAAVPPGEQHSFAEWRARAEPGEPGEEYAPRAQVGRYLVAAFETLARHSPPHIRITVVKEAVTAVTRSGTGLRVATADGSSDFDEVLVTTGHARSWTGALANGWSHDAPLVPAVFPVEAMLAADRVPPGSMVAARGLALTFIDSALALTEGRGGSFEPRGDSDSFIYHPSGNEPATIYPFSRTGRLMLAKYEAEPAPDAWQEPLDDAAERIRKLPRGTDVDALRAVVAGAAAASSAPPGDEEELLGKTWRALYPAIVERVGGDGLDDGEWPGFLALAAEMERVAFGPPPESAAKLDALIKAGFVDLTHARRGRLVSAGGQTSLHSDEGATAIDVVIDAVLPPPGATGLDQPLLTQLVEEGLARVRPERRGLEVQGDATCVPAPGSPPAPLAAYGRPTEDFVIGNDTLSRVLHPQIDRWADRVGARLPGVRDGCHGVVPLSGRLEPWQVGACRQGRELGELLDEHGSPVNLIEPRHMGRNADALRAAASDAGVRLGIYFARKANKSLALVDEAIGLGLGVDVASEPELGQVLDRGVDPSSVVVTAAVKPRSLLELAVAKGATLIIDNLDEASQVVGVAAGSKGTTVGLRVAPEIAGRVPTRFGLQPAEAVAAAELLAGAGLGLAGLHFHLDGYDVADRVSGIEQSLELADGLGGSAAGLRFLDIGGGIPMSYLDSREQWDTFWTEHRRGLSGDREPLTFEGHGLGLTLHGKALAGTPNVYPYHQEPVGGDWLVRVLASEVSVNGTTATVAKAVVERGLELRLEPGRSLLDGCGMTVARVMFTKRRADGVNLVGLGMNRTQCRSTSDDFLVDPLLIEADGAKRGPAGEGYLVGAYCIERELLTWRRLAFPRGVAVGDMVAFPNTAGYLMHILESASHQIPLARNLVVGPSGASLDPIDRGGT